MNRTIGVYDADISYEKKYTNKETDERSRK